MVDIWIPFGSVHFSFILDINQVTSQWFNEWSIVCDGKSVCVCVYVTTESLLLIWMWQSNVVYIIQQLDQWQSISFCASFPLQECKIAIRISSIPNKVSFNFSGINCLNLYLSSEFIWVISLVLFFRDSLKSSVTFLDPHLIFSPESPAGKFTFR